MEKEAIYVRMASFSACIGYDRRYTDTLEVSYLPESNEVRVLVTDTAPIGGMDGPGGVRKPEPRYETTVPAVPKAILTAIQGVIRNNSYNFHEYGKPSKNFRFYGVAEAGISLGKVVLALAVAKGDFEYRNNPALNREIAEARPSK